MPIISSISGNFSPVGRSKKPKNNIIGGEVAYYSIGDKRYKSNSFLSSGISSFVVTTSLDPFDILIIAGGGGGGANQCGGGGGAGGFHQASGVSLISTTYSIQVGAGGGGFAQGGDSVITGYLSVPGGGRGAGASTNNLAPTGGGSGGGGAGWGSNQNYGAGGTAPYGNGGGYAPYGQSLVMGGGGGGAGGVGQNQIAEFSGGAGGAGLPNSFRTGSPVTYCTGGQASSRDYIGGGSGANNSGNGGVGNYGTGGSGMIVIRYEID